MVLRFSRIRHCRGIDFDEFFEDNFTYIHAGGAARKDYYYYKSKKLNGSRKN